MKFQHAEPDENFPLLHLVSTGGKWELGFSPVIFGVRVRLGLVGAVAVNLDYCAGADPLLRLEILLLLVRILAPIGEDTLSEAMIRQIFPGWKVRPINDDPECMTRLRELADRADVPHPVPASVAFFANGQAMVFDSGGQQIPAYQGRHQYTVDALRMAGHEWTDIPEVFGCPNCSRI